MNHATLIAAAKTLVQNGIARGEVTPPPPPEPALPRTNPKARGPLTDAHKAAMKAGHRRHYSERALARGRAKAATLHIISPA